MMKKLILSICLFISFLYLNANDSKNNRSVNNSTAKIELIFSDIQSSIVRFSFDNYKTSNIQTPSGIAKNISLNGAFPMQITGAPDLLKISASVIIPDDAKMEVKVISKSFTDSKHFNCSFKRKFIQRY